MPKVSQYYYHNNNVEYTVNTYVNKNGNFSIQKKHLPEAIQEVCAKKFTINQLFDTLEDLNKHIHGMIEFAIKNTIEKTPVILISILLKKSTINVLKNQFESIDLTMFNDNFCTIGHGFEFSWKAAVSIKIGGVTTKYIHSTFIHSDSIHPNQSTKNYYTVAGGHYVWENGSKMYQTDHYFELPFTIKNYEFVSTMELQIAALSKKMVDFFGNDPLGLPVKLDQFKLLES